MSPTAAGNRASLTADPKNGCRPARTCQNERRTNRPLAFLIALATIYMALLAMLAMMVPEGNTGPLWNIWLICTLGCLTGTAMELTFVLLWAWLSVTDQLHRDPYVPLQITAHQRRDLDEMSVKVAMLMPAHREVTTPGDAEAFIERAVQLICRSPAYVDLFFLFDSPCEEQEHEREVIVQIKSQLQNIGRASDACRVRAETYRHKPPQLKNKPGSIKMWLDRYDNQYDYMIVLDADSSLLEPDPSRPATCDCIERMVWAMQQHPQLAMIQAAILVQTDPTAWGWFQTAGVGMATRYHGLLMQWLLEGQAPSYGHNNIFRITDFVHHVRNTLEYLSHDFLDASDLAAAGRTCIQTHHVLTGEQGEPSLLSFVVRDLRWSRGNAQWINYWMTKARLPLGPRIYIAIGILSYVWPLLASVLLIASALLLNADVPLIDATRPWAVGGLLGLVLASLLLPKALAASTIAQFNGVMLIGLLMTPSLMMIQGILFLLGAFGKKWTLRAPRTAQMNGEHARGVVTVFAPVCLVGLFVWTFLLNGLADNRLGEFLIRLHVLLLVASPLLAVAFSWPLPVRNYPRHPARDCCKPRVPYRS